MPIAARMTDANLSLKASGAITVTTTGTFIDLGAATEIRGDIVIDVTSVVSNDGNEFYILTLQGSTDGSTLGAYCAQCLWDAATPTSLPAANSKLVIPFTNAPYGTPYRYVRLVSTLSGTTPSANFAARISKGATS